VSLCRCTPLCEVRLLASPPGAPGHTPDVLHPLSVLLAGWVTQTKERKMPEPDLKSYIHAWRHSGCKETSFSENLKLLSFNILLSY